MSLLPVVLNFEKINYVWERNWEPESETESESEWEKENHSEAVDQARVQLC